MICDESIKERLEVFGVTVAAASVAVGVSNEVWLLVAAIRVVMYFNNE